MRLHVQMLSARFEAATTPGFCHSETVLQSSSRRHIDAGIELRAAQHTAVDVLASGDAETEPGCDGMSEVRKTRKGEWWQLHGRSAAEVTCAAVMPPAECVGYHGPEELRHQMLPLANVVSGCLAMDTRWIGVEVHEP